MSNNNDERCWLLKRYAIYVYESETDVDSGIDTSQQSSSQQWKWNCMVAEAPKDMILHVTQRHMFRVIKGDTILENLCILASRSWARAILKGDSMLFTFRMNSELKRFRVQFDNNDSSTGQEQCRRCARVLSTYFSIKDFAEPKTSVQEINCDLTPEDMVKRVLDPEQVTRAYEAVSSYSEEQVEELVFMCLMDPTFPSFVSKVENVLEKVNGEGVLDEKK